MESLSIYGLTQCHKKCSKVYSVTFPGDAKRMVATVPIRFWSILAKNVTSLSKERLMLSFQAAPTTVYADTMQQAMMALKESASTLTQGIMIK